MQKIIELNKKEKNLVSGGDLDRGETGFSYDLDGFNCTLTNQWPMNEGPCTKPDRFACHPPTSDSQNSLLWNPLNYIPYIALAAFSFAGVYVPTRMYMYRKVKKAQ